MSKQLRLDVAQLTDVGRKRPHNEDNMAYVIPKDPQVMARKGALFIVADGMGGHAAGEVASEIAVDTVSNTYYQEDSDDAAVSLLHAIRRANSLIHQRAAENMLRSGMGTTCVAAVLRGNIGYIANVGDSRAYLVRHGQVRQVSQDHSWVAEQVRAGLLTEEQARSHAQRNVITRCLGTQSEVEVDVFSEPLEEGDSIVLCTDGLSGLVADDELRVIVNQFVPQESVYHLVERANENGGPDNITAIVIRVQEVGWDLPNARYPVRVGGREANEDTVNFGPFPGTSVNGAPRPDDIRFSSVSRIPTGSLTSPEIPLTAAQAAPPARRSRLFYPTILLVVLLLAAVVGGGSYFFLRASGRIVDVDGSLSTASTMISQAKAIQTTNPTLALQKLTTARATLLTIQNSSLSNTQNTSFKSLQISFTQTVKGAITAYNQQSSILALSCLGTSSSNVGVAGDAVQAISLEAAIEDAAGKNVLTYVLGSDQNLYSLTAQHVLDKKVTVGGKDNSQIIAVAGDVSQMLVLANSTPAQGKAATYTLNLFQPQANGTLRDGGTIPVTPGNEYAPKFLVASSTDVYVVSMSQATSSSPIILDYAIIKTGDQNNLSARPSSPMKISISKTIASVAAINTLPKKQLVFLFNDGSIQSLQVTGGVAASPSPVNVLAQTAIPLTLSVSSNDFTFNAQTAVPVPVPLTTNLPAPLSVSGATILASGMVGNEDGHLYVVAAGSIGGAGARILDLQVVQGVTRTATAPTPASTTGNVGGGVATQDTSMYMQVAHQYAPDASLMVKAIAVDPKGSGFSVLTPKGPNSTLPQLVSVAWPLQQKTCAA